MSRINAHQRKFERDDSDDERSKKGGNKKHNDSFENLSQRSRAVKPSL